MLIEVSNLSKVYPLYISSKDRLKEALHPLRKSYHSDFYALRNLSFSVKKGEVFGILGRNGSGKSTLLKILSSVLTPTSGSVLVKAKVTALLELGSGFNPELTGLENLYFNATLLGVKKKELEQKIGEIVDFADIGEFLHQPLKVYSSGMKARLAFAFSIHTKPEILILDEVLSVGDAAFARKCYAKIEQMCKNEDVTVLIVSHSTQTMLNLCDRVMVLHHGKKVLEGKPKDVIKLYLKLIQNNTPKELLLQEYQKMLSSQTQNAQQSEDFSAFSQELSNPPTVHFGNKKAYIKDVEILNSHGEKVNILEYAKAYTICYTLECKSSFSNLKLALFLKTNDSIRLGGKEVEFALQEGVSSYKLSWKFTPKLNAGIFLFNFAVIDEAYGERTVLHRVIDAYMFRVVLREKKEFTGFVDFDFEFQADL